MAKYGKAVTRRNCDRICDAAPDEPSRHKQCRACVLSQADSMSLRYIDINLALIVVACYIDDKLIQAST